MILTIAIIVAALVGGFVGYHWGRVDEKYKDLGPY